MAVRECVWMCAYAVPTYTSVLAGLGRWMWGAVDYWCMQPRRARTSAYREVCVRVESCVPWWKAGSHQTCVHVDLFSLTKLAASTVVAWWGLQDRQTHSQGASRWQSWGRRKLRARAPPQHSQSWTSRAHVQAQLTCEWAGFNPIPVNPAVLHHCCGAVSGAGVGGPGSEIDHKFLEML